MDNYEIEERLLEGNHIYVESLRFDEDKIALQKEFVKGQNPYACIICCSDSRVVPEEIFCVNMGDIFVIRSAGNVINEGELASIEYAIEHLHITYIAVMGHTRCGAIHAAMHNEQGKYLDPILKRIKLSIKGSLAERTVVLNNVKAQIEYIKEKFPNFTGEVRPLIYEIESGVVIDY